MTDSDDEVFAQFRDAAVVEEKLDLEGEPAFVEMVGRNVKFVIPGGGADE